MILENGHQKYEVTSYGDVENDSVVIFTKECGAVVISNADTPELWQQFTQQRSV